MSHNTTSHPPRDRDNRGPRRDNSTFRRPRATPAPPKTFGQKVKDFFCFTWLRKEAPVQAIRNQSQGRLNDAPSRERRQREPREPRERRHDSTPPPESDRLYIGNLSYDATESDLYELFSSAGPVESAEIVTHSRTQRSKGYAFVSMRTIADANRAAELLHDKDFMGRKLVVNSARPPSTEPRRDWREGRSQGSNENSRVD